MCVRERERWESQETNRRCVGLFDVMLRVPLDSLEKLLLAISISLPFFPLSMIRAPYLSCVACLLLSGIVITASTSKVVAIVNYLP